MIKPGHDKAKLRAMHLGGARLNPPLGGVAERTKSRQLASRMTERWSLFRRAMATRVATSMRAPLIRNSDTALDNKDGR
jgi:hypothetical protein